MYQTSFITLYTLQWNLTYQYPPILLVKMFTCACYWEYWSYEYDWSYFWEGGRRVICVYIISDGKSCFAIHFFFILRTRQGSTVCWNLLYIYIHAHARAHTHCS